jgi:hypothetical protein
MAKPRYLVVLDAESGTAFIRKLTEKEEAEAVWHANYSSNSEWMECTKIVREK